MSIDNLNDHDFEHIAETVQSLREEWEEAVSACEDVDGWPSETPEEIIMTSIGYVNVGYDPDGDGGWVEAYGERRDVGDNGWPVDLDDDREEYARELGMGLGVNAYNDAMGCGLGNPEED